MQNEQMNQQVDPRALTEEEELDLQIAVNLGKRLLDSGGYDVIEQAASQSNNPPEVIGQFLTQLMSQMQESFPPELEVSPRIYLAAGGFLDEIGDEIRQTTGMDEQSIEDAKIYAAENMMAAAQEPQPEQQAPPGQPPQGGPPMPPQGGMV